MTWQSGILIRSMCIMFLILHQRDGLEGLDLWLQIWFQSIFLLHRKITWFFDVVHGLWWMWWKSTWILLDMTRTNNFNFNTVLNFNFNIYSYLHVDVHLPNTRTNFQGKSTLDTQSPWLVYSPPQPLSNPLYMQLGTSFPVHYETGDTSLPDRMGICRNL